jgi:predicted ATPase
VNLIVGQNAVGKSALLEALLIWGSVGGGHALRSAYEQRNEDSVRRLFSAASNGETLRFHVGPARRVIQVECGDGYVVDSGTATAPMCIVEVGSYREKIRLDKGFTERRAVPVNPDAAAEFEECKLITSSGVSPGDVAKLWDQIALTPAEDKVLAASRLIHPKIERLNVLGDPREPHVKMAGDGRTPLRSLGEGVTRLLGIALTLVSCANGLLLIDEVENGLHYSVHPKLWKLVIDTALQLNVQVFATTHSRDCLEAFQEALSNQPESTGMVTRLERRRGTIVAVQFAQHELQTVVRELLEVR